MAYTATVWREHSMDSTAKLAALNNLESMYAEGVSYIDAITHAASYYTEAQADARYLPKGVKTTGSIAMTLDGSDAAAIMAAGTPQGVIAIWSGTEASIATNAPGWHLCDGSSGTPDLRNKFVVGAGSNYARNESGGSNTCTTSATITVAGHALTAAETPLHTHGNIVDNYPTSLTHIDHDYYTTGKQTTGVSDVARNTGTTGSGTSHNHTASFAGTASQDKRPPFMARCYIMRV
jgi:hypothetical protein